ncbi:MAG: ATP-binding protein [Pseudomonadota bacterium]
MTIADDGHVSYRAELVARHTITDTFLDGLRSGVGRRFTFAAVACSSVLALFMTLLQLGVDFRTERSLHDASLAKIEESILPALAESVWILDRTLIESQLNGIAQIEGVNRVGVLGAGEVFLVESETQVAAKRVELPINRVSNGEARLLGTLVVESNYTHIWARIIDRAAIVFVTNFLKTICVTFVLLYIFQRLIGRHLHRLTQFSNAYDPKLQGQRLKFDKNHSRGARARKDEFDILEASINRWCDATETYLAQLKHTNLEQAEFSYAVSHDLKSPTNTMAMLIEELNDHAPLDEDSHTILENMRITNKRMGDLVTDVLDYSRLVDRVLETEPVDVGVMLGEIMKDLSADIAEAKAKISFQDLPVIDGNAFQIRILLQNLISNAIKFRRPNQKTYIRITASQSAEATVLRVEDNGIGIPEKFRTRVFGLFKRLHTSSEYHGTGLGLSISRRVMSNHGGHISISDGIEGGTAFNLHFPRERHD